MDMIYECIPEFETLDGYVENLLSQNYSTMRQWVWDMIKSGEILDKNILLEKIQMLFIGEVRQMKSVFVTIVFLFFASAFMQAVVDALHHKGANLIGKYFFLFLELCFLAKIWIVILESAQENIATMLNFMKIATPAYMTAIALTGKEITSVLFQKVLLECICGMEGVGISLTLGMVKIYVIFAVLEVVYHDGKFVYLLQFIKKGIHLLMKVCFVVLNMGNIFQLMVIASVDNTNREILQKTVSGIPGIGDLSDSISSVTFSALSTIRNSVGVGIILILLFLLLPGLIKIGCIILSMKAGAALGSIIGDSYLNGGIQFFAEAGYMALKIMVMIATLFLASVALLMQ